MSTHTLLEGSTRREPELATRGEAANPKEMVEITVTLRPKTALPGVVAHTTAPKTLEAIENEHSATQTDADLVVQELKKFGLTPGRVSLAGRSVDFTGTVAQMEDAFKTHLAIYSPTTGSPMSAGAMGAFRGRTDQLQIPIALRGIVTGVFGLDTRRAAAPRSAAAAPPATGLRPQDLSQMYGFGKETAAGQVVGILEFGGAYIPSDLAQFVGQVGLPLPEVTVIEVPKGSQTNANDPTSVEVMMDIEIVAAMAPGAAIKVYFAPFTERGWVNLLKHIIHETDDKPNVISISYGEAESAGGFSVAGMQVIDGYFQEAAQLGITVCVSSGDDGCGSLTFDGTYNANFPASSPNVLAVGGTMLVPADGNQEEAWWEAPGRRFDANGQSTGGGATGGGCSVVFTRPPWQTVNIANLQTGATTGRVVPDVSALAGPPFYFLVFNGSVQPNGGTSAAAPLWASVLARMRANGKNVGFFPPVLYQGTPTIGSQVCRDITKGNNASNPPMAGYDANKGFDAVTGWGVPNVSALLTNPGI